MNILTVTQLNRYIKALVEADEHLHTVYLKGEISNFTDHYKSGHFYFSLKDENSLIRSVMFRSYASKVKFEPENGMTVVVKASVSVYERDGQYQLYVYEMQPDGIGALHLAYEQLKAKLYAQGLFDERYKRALPRYPRTIGVITSPTGAAVRDIENILSRRYPLAQMLLFPVLVQGDGAPAQLIRALRYFESAKSVDVIILGRGGGSIEELWAFNNEQLAYEIFRCTIPVISAVGHETDYTIADFVADVRAPTPSAAAELAVPDVRQLMLRLDQMGRKLDDLIQGSLLDYEKRLAACRKKDCMKKPGYLLLRKEELLTGLKQDLLRSVEYCLVQRRESFLRLQKDFRYASNTALTKREQEFLRCTAMLDTLSPLKVLTRGYGMVHRGKKIISSVHGTKPGEKIEVLLGDGNLTCRVLETTPSESEEHSERENDI